MPTLGHELLRVHRFVVEIRFERQSPQRAVASFSDLRNDLVEQVRGTSGWSYHRNYSPSRDWKQPLRKDVSNARHHIPTFAQRA